MTSNWSFPDPDSALAALADRLAVVSQASAETMPWGRILAAPVCADRPSPAADVSAMDGYALRYSDIRPDVSLPVSGESSAGSPPPPHTTGQAVRIFTGAIVPNSCDTVLKREDTEEHPEHIRIPASVADSTRKGDHIRRAGENADAGSTILPAGCPVSPASAATLANFGCLRPSVFRKVRVTIATTGYEVVDPSAGDLEPWQLRNSNRVALESLFAALPFVDLGESIHLEDDRRTLTDLLRHAITRCDALIISGGVSKGDYDFVPACLAELGGEILFHGLPIRPGKPILGASTSNGQLLLGLPGNPVSATVNAHRFAVPLLRRIGGYSRWEHRPALATLSEPLGKKIPLHVMPLVRQLANGRVEAVPAKGSGDLVALGQSDGYLSIAPLAETTGPWPLFLWPTIA